MSASTDPRLAGPPLRTEIVDAHHHLWRYSPEEYPWIGEEDLAIRRDFGPAELEAELDAAGVAGTVAVQARQSLEETRRLLEIATVTPRIRGVVGWVPLADPGVGELLDELLSESEKPATGHLAGGDFVVGSRLVGVRHVVQDESDPEFLLRPAFARGLAALPSRNLAYDLLVKPHQLSMALACVDAHPGLRFVVDHAAKPDFGGSLEAWAAGMRALAERPNLYCKFSGLALEAGPGWSVSTLRPVFDILLDCFGPTRLMFGSDWPVCLLATGYARWLGAVHELSAALSDTERASIFGRCARTAYCLEVSP